LIQQLKGDDHGVGHLGSSRDSGVYEEVLDYLIGLRRLDWSVTLSPIERRKYRNVIFAKLLKNRHGELGREVALDLGSQTLEITENQDRTIDESDLDRIARTPGGRRR
jgi:hypothetical protein|tara:strand:- start:110 stop:433 length:324 start_codon:yes stop_codon:yes gene_type:complete